MIVPDVNLLVYAYDSKAPHHPRARAWWEGLLGRRDRCGVAGHGPFQRHRFRQISGPAIAESPGDGLTRPSRSATAGSELSGTKLAAGSD